MPKDGSWVATPASLGLSGSAFVGFGGERGAGVGVNVRLKMSLRELAGLPERSESGDWIGRWVAGEKVSDVGEGVTGTTGDRGGESLDDIDGGSRSGSVSTSTIRGRGRDGRVD